jgi:hypothetical protein
METPGRNEPCRCGSGKKWKRCCLPKSEPIAFTREERISAWTKLDHFIGDELDDEEDAAWEELWGRWADRLDELGDDFAALGDRICELWFTCDRRLDEGDLVVDRFLDDRAADLSTGEKAYLRTLRASSMRLYEVEDSRPGESLTLRDLLEGDRVTVHERLGSRSLLRHEWIAARVVATGASGRPEIEGLVAIADLYHQTVRDQLRGARDGHLKKNAGASIESFYKMTPPFFVDAWAGSIIDPAVPRLSNTDGEELVLTRVLFDVLEAPALVAALDQTDGLERDHADEDLWHWSGKNGKGDLINLGLLKLRERTLELEANSVARGTRGRALVESVAGGAVRHHGTTHEDLQRAVKERLRSGRAAPGPERADAIPFEVQEALVLDRQARYYRGWLDEPNPALSDRTPRVAAQTAALRSKLVELLSGLDRTYQRSLKAGEPAFDPSWMWRELGLDEENALHPPPLAHERVDQLVSGSGAVCRQVAEALRLQPGFDDAATVFTPEDARTNVVLQRFLRERSPFPSGQSLAAHLQLMVNFDLHRRKCFWVDESLAYMLAHTELDLGGNELRVPFPSFALVFTDRHALSLAERLLARQPGCLIAGEYLRVVTAFVLEHGSGRERALEMTFACDALGADAPFLVTHTIPVTDAEEVEAFLDKVAPTMQVQPAVEDANPLRDLIGITLNAILYATSAGVEPEVRRAPSATRRPPRLRGGPPVTFSSDEVYFLPGAIEISQVRRLQELERAPDGRTILRRFMVRGHWRRAAASWEDQRMRWIQPHWKGPDLAAIIERTYKLKP